MIDRVPESRQTFDAETSTVLARGFAEAERLVNGVRIAVLGVLAIAAAIYAQLPTAVGWVFGLACWGVGVLPSTFLGIVAASSAIALWVRQLPGEGQVELDLRYGSKLEMRITAALVCFAVTLLLAVGLSFADFDGAWR